MGSIIRAVTGGESSAQRTQRRAKRLADATAETARTQAAKVKAEAAAKVKAEAAAKVKAEDATAKKKKAAANELAGQQSQAGKLALIATAQGGIQGDASTGKRKLFGN